MTANPEDAAAVVALAVTDLAEALTGYHADDWRDAVHLLRAVRASRHRLAALDDTLTRWLYLHGEHGQHQLIDGIPGQVAITRSRARERWDERGVLTDYIEAKIRANDGEAPDPLEVVSWVLEVASVGYCRTTAVRAAGLDVADYRTSEPGKPSVSVPVDDLTT